MGDIGRARRPGRSLQGPRLEEPAQLLAAILGADLAIGNGIIGGGLSRPTASSYNQEAMNDTERSTMGIRCNASTPSARGSAPFRTAGDLSLTARAFVSLRAAFGALWCVAALAASPASAADACKDVPRPFVAPIPAAHAAAAAALLGSQSVADLTDAQASMLLDVALGPLSLADTMLSRAIAELEQKREAEMDRQQGSWSLRDADELASLVRLEAQLMQSAPRPFLVRAVRGFEGTGSYGARDCGDTLSVFHGSLGHQTPPPTPSAVVVFLMRKPTRIDASYSVIE